MWITVFLHCPGVSGEPQTPQRAHRNKSRNYRLLPLCWATDLTEHIPLVKTDNYKKKPQIIPLSMEITCPSFQRSSTGRVDDFFCDLNMHLSGKNKL